MNKLAIVVVLCSVCMVIEAQSAKEYFSLSNEVSQAAEGDNELLLQQSRQLLDWSTRKYEVKRGGKDTLLSVTPYTALIGHAIYYARIDKLDSTFFYLQQAIDHGMDDKLVFVDNYKDFHQIYNTPQTIKMKRKMNKRFLSSLATSNERKIAKQVIDMFESDQYIRTYYEYSKHILKADSVELNSIKSRWETIDRRNQIAMMDILDNYGYPGKSLMGDSRAECAFFIIQHFKDVELQQKYYPVLKQAAEQGELDPFMLMMIEDRINIKEGNVQKHGTQTFIIE